MALFNLDSNKTLRLDRFEAGFFKNYQHIIKKDVFNYISKFITNGQLLKEINLTFIVLIPKIANLS